MFNFLKNKFRRFEEAIGQEVAQATAETTVEEQPMSSQREQHAARKVGAELRQTITLEKELTTVDKKTTLQFSEKKLDELLWNLEIGLLEADVALPVVDDDNHPIGILTTTDLLETVSKPPQEEGYYVRVIGDVDEADMDQVIEMGVELVKKFASIIGTSGQLYIHAKAVPKKKFRGPCPKYS